MAELSAYGWHGKNVDQGGSYWILVDAFAGSVQLPNCLCCSCALQLPAICHLQQMSNLEEKHPDVYRKFLDGFHVVLRSNQCWAGLSSDLVIEQTLMRFLKSTCGLSRGSGMTEDMRILWTLSAPVTSEYNIAMQDFTNLT